VIDHYLRFLTGATIAMVIAGAAVRAQADGGKLCVSEQVGSWRLSVFASRSMLGTGETDFTVCVQDVDTGSVVADVGVTVTARHAASGSVTTRNATSAEATNKLLRSALLNLQPAGDWQVTVDVTSANGEQHSVGFELAVRASTPAWFDTSLWVGWPIIPIALFSVHQFLVRKRAAKKSTFG
jgi:hypothetical protein